MVCPPYQPKNFPKKCNKIAAAISNYRKLLGLDFKMTIDSTGVFFLFGKGQIAK
jgi:hypothetical protein